MSSADAPGTTDAPGFTDAPGSIPAQVVEADLTWITDEATGRGAFEPGTAVVIDDTGSIVEVRPCGGDTTLRLRGQALLPGFVNAHSHAFQRGLRGLGESFPAGQGTFWTWREAMYELVERLDREGFLRLTTQAFSEMRRAGFTTVGEFHYFHHARNATDFAYDGLVLEAARAAGVRIVLLEACYLHGGVERRLEGGQRRFDGVSVERFVRQLDRIAGLCDGDLARLGVVAHSLRAVTPSEAAELYSEARHRGLVFHIHLEEQRAELEEIEAAYGRRPLRLLTETLAEAEGTAEGVVAVHCTHSSAEDLTRFFDAGGRACLCPLTEANLGDGIADLPAMLEHPSALSLGSDSNARISPWEEMRWLEYAQRLRRERRGVAVDDEGDCARRLLSIATEGGAAALGLDCGRIASGLPADLVAIDLESPTLAGADPGSLMAAAIFGGDREIVASTAVAGRWRKS